MAIAKHNPALSVVIPTYNERENMLALSLSLNAALRGVHYEVLIVDDNSPDGTADFVQEMIDLNEGLQDGKWKIIRRGGKLGLASAVFDGVDASSGDFIAVLDADGSHPPGALPKMMELAEKGDDLVIGSRFTKGSQFEHQPIARTLISYFLNLTVRTMFRLKPRDVLAGYVVCRREIITRMPTRYSAGGFKWLLEVLAARNRPFSVCEHPITFYNRREGSSKAGIDEVFELARLCALIAVWRVRRFISTLG